jgi:TRAP-type C4-dicarboxylate transport system permease large subunit
MMLVWLVLGMLIDSVSIILLTVPIFAPMALVLGLDPIAFAIFGILVIEAGLLTPPFGLLVYTVKGSVPDKEATLGMIFRGSTPYFLLILVAALIVLWLPILATWLPYLMF